MDLVSEADSVASSFSDEDEAELEAKRARWHDPSALLALPLEVFLHVVGLIRRTSSETVDPLGMLTLGRLSRTCRKVRSILEPELYHCISFASDTPHARHDPRCLVRTLSNRLSLGLLVRSLDLGPHDDVADLLLPYLPCLTHLTCSDVSALAYAPRSLVCVNLVESPIPRLNVPESWSAVTHATLDALCFDWPNKLPSLKHLTVTVAQPLLKTAPLFQGGRFAIVFRLVRGASLESLRIRLTHDHCHQGIHHFPSLLTLVPSSLKHLSLSGLVIDGLPDVPTVTGAAFTSDDLADSSSLEVLDLLGAHCEGLNLAPFRRLHTIRCWTVDLFNVGLFTSPPILPPSLSQIVLCCADENPDPPHHATRILAMFLESKSAELAAVGKTISGFMTRRGATCRLDGEGGTCTGCAELEGVARTLEVKRMADVPDADEKYFGRIIWGEGAIKCEWPFEDQR